MFCHKPFHAVMVMLYYAAAMVEAAPPTNSNDPSSSSPADGSQFVGLYREVGSDNFDAFLGAMGVNAFIRSMASAIKQEYIVAYDRSKDQYRIRMVTSLRESQFQFRSDEPYMVKQLSGNSNRALTHVDLENHRWLQKSLDPPQATVVRQFSPQGMVATYKLGGVTAVKRYRKIQSQSQQSKQARKQ